jgi:Tfp pilus assembly protein PilX
MRLIANRFRRLCDRLRREEGVTMVTASGVALVVMLASVAALAAADSDHGLSRDDVQRKQALAAAEAGLADYVQDLNSDNAYWSKCVNVPAPNAVNQRWSGSGADTRVPRSPNNGGWRSVPAAAGTTQTNDFQYAIELLPANGASACSEADAAGTMLDSATGTFRIRSTGRVRRPDASCSGSPPCYEKRSLVSQFRRRGFLDYLYFTDFETSDPAWYSIYTYGGLPLRNGAGQSITIPGWAATACAQWWRDGRGNERFLDLNGDGDQDAEVFFNGNWVEYDPPTGGELLSCTNIQFADGDRIKGPFHTNDEILVCGDPDFGRSSADAIEVSAPAPGYRSNCGGGSAPELVNGAEWKPNSPIIAMPPSNSKVKQQTQSAYVFKGGTAITLNGSTMTVTDERKGLNNTSMALPSNGVIFIENDTDCGSGYDPTNPYPLPPGQGGCADLYLSGTYSSDLTIASEKDIIIRGDIKRSGGATPVDKVLGLIANQFVRIYHPVNPGCGSNIFPGTMTNVTVEAAILALQHSFTVDNYSCGNALGELTVFGVIAQKFRGPVGTGGSSGVSTGYLKNYNYDDRLRLRQPPHFLDPVQSSWRVMRQWEQVPAF